MLNQEPHPGGDENKAAARGPFRKAGIAFALLLAGASLAIAAGVSTSYWIFGRMEQAVKARAHTTSVLAGAEDLMSALKDAETGQRGFLLTDDEAFLEPYLAVRDGFGAKMDELWHVRVPAAARIRLDALVPLVDAELADISLIIDLHRSGHAAAALALVREGTGKRLMDSIREEIAAFTDIEKTLLAQHEAALGLNLRRLLAFIVGAGLLAFLTALWFAYSTYRRARLRIGTPSRERTRKRLSTQEALNEELRQANTTLRNSEENLAVTLNSIGDAVIATDADTLVTQMNPVAEHLTGWSFKDAVGRPVIEVFNIINKATRKPSTVPVMETLSRGTIQGLANHTVLIARDKSECDIADSCAPILDREGRVIGAVLVFRDVTKEYATQLALRDSVALVQTIYNTVADGLVTLHAQGGIVETVNPAAEEMFGFSAAELKGKPLSLLIPELDQDQPTVSLGYLAASVEAQANGQARQVTGRRKDGTGFPLEMAASEMRMGEEGYFTCLLRDITARKQAEEALAKAGLLQNAIFSNPNFSCIATDAKGVIQIFNVGAQHMLGYAADQVVNRITPADITDPHEVLARAEALSIEQKKTIAPGFEALVFKASRGIEDTYESTYVRKDGSSFPVVVSVTALRDDQDAIIGYLLIGTDNSAYKKTEAERILLDQSLLEKNIELEGSKVLAEKANLAKSEFLSSMSHELRTPLSAILGFAQLMETGTPPPTTGQKRSIEQILKAGWYLLELINEILDLALIESGKLSMSMEPISLGEVMRECETMIEPSAKKRNVSVAFTHFEKPCFVKADRTRVKQILINLLSNAIKYNKAGGTVAVESALSGTESIRISVRDSGEGLAPERIAQLFQPFNRLGQEAKSEQGTGIGLVVSKRLVELMGGNIGVESTVGQGSVFWVELNLTPEPEKIRETTTEAELPDIDPSRYTLLYVEDNPANLMLVEDLIARRSDIRLLSAKDGISGVALARFALPDAILMDINLPGISGLNALKILSDDPTTAHIPIVALSANAIPHDIEKGLEAGFFRYLTKPIKVDEFMKTLDLTLAASKRKA